MTHTHTQHHTHTHSHSSRDYTSSFGATEREGSFTPNIHNRFNRYMYLFYTCNDIDTFVSCSKVQSCILDGEMVGWDSETESYL